MRLVEIFWRFLLLGCTSFGGPAAHVGYFRTVFVERLRWLEEESFGRLFALSQFLPGPGSSQLGFAIGCERGGALGGVAAFLGFTLPSFVLMFMLAVSSAGGSLPAGFSGVIHGLKLLAVVVVADATLGMFRSFCRSKLTAALCVVTAAAMLIYPGMAAQFVALIVGASVGTMFLGTSTARQPGGTTNKPRLHWLPLILFALLFVAAPFASGGWMKLTSGFYQAGSLVFGGGHVVLPLLQNHSVSSGLTSDQFLLGYASAQGVPGPMFTLAAFLGAEVAPGSALAGATLATAAIFLPGFLLLLGLKDAWDTLSKAPRLNGGIGGLNAVVVGLLAAALYRPVFASSVSDPTDFAAVLVGFYLLRSLKLPVVAVVVTFAVAGLLLHG
jgi:chromate transporter